MPPTFWADRQQPRNNPESHKLSGQGPSMRRPVSVKTFLSSFLFSLFLLHLFPLFPNCSRLFPFSQAASVATLPSALFVERLSPGASWVFLIQ